jgi:ABC-type enterobactin transport system permease subunit
MNLDRPAIIGIVLGALIGGANAALQIYELRRKNRTVQPKGVTVLVPGAVGRLMFLVVAWWLAFRFTEADKYWLTGALAVTYTMSLLVQLKQLILPKK